MSNHGAFGRYGGKGRGVSGSYGGKGRGVSGSHGGGGWGGVRNLRLAYDRVRLLEQCAVHAERELVQQHVDGALYKKVRVLIQRLPRPRVRRGAGGGGGRTGKFVKRLTWRKACTSPRRKASTSAANSGSLPRVGAHLGRKFNDNGTRMAAENKKSQRGTR
jgi:hypothetical protein